VSEEERRTRRPQIGGVEGGGMISAEWESEWWFIFHRLGNQVKLRQWDKGKREIEHREREEGRCTIPRSAAKRWVWSALGGLVWSGLGRRGEASERGTPASESARRARDVKSGTGFSMSEYEWQRGSASDEEGDGRLYRAGEWIIIEWSERDSSDKMKI
jgi:hypothetical protein